MLAPKSKQEKESKMHLKNLDRQICPSGHCLATHYENIPMQYTAIFHGCKNVNFQMKNSDIFLIFAQNIGPTIKNCWFAVLLPTHPKQALPKKFYCLSEDFFFFGNFFSNFVNKKYF